MKKFYLLLLMLVTGGWISAQTFTIMTPIGGAPGLISPAGGTVVTGDTVVYCDDNLDSSTIVTAKLWVVNETGSTLSTAVRRYEECLVSGSGNYFCWDICWSELVNVSGIMTINAGDTAKYFYGDYKAKTNPGASVVRYRFYDDNNPNSAYNEVYIKYNAGDCAAIQECYVGLEEENTQELTSVYPNPASEQITFEYSTGGYPGMITISDISGKTVRTIKVNENSTKTIIDLDGLNAGVYFYGFSINNKPISTRKFIIKK